jgi:hypothetical protein
VHNLWQVKIGAVLFLGRLYTSFHEIKLTNVWHTLICDIIKYKPRGVYFSEISIFCMMAFLQPSVLH